ncbi:hypothetical protein CFOL_v3_23113 [Cephalotus follicularis]|uniref:Uncharacterized protein n=1 Tax=Cephalotus follicularis TaxID=3775 RepID=A0A1Q3CHF9_CEPFO|nr:hypothetical protein CFOL_v3_23113 [Cephalotus follicularis]
MHCRFHNLKKKKNLVFNTYIPSLSLTHLLHPSFSAISKLTDQPIKSIPFTLCSLLNNASPYLFLPSPLSSINALSLKQLMFLSLSHKYFLPLSSPTLQLRPRRHNR